MKERSIGVYPGEDDGEILVNFESGQKGVRLKSLLPEEARGDGFGGFDVRGYFRLAQLILVSPEDLHSFNRNLDLKQNGRGTPIKGHLPPINPQELRLCTSDGELDPDRTAAAFEIVAAYWEQPQAMGIHPGYVAAALRNGVTAPEIVSFIRHHTQIDPKTGQPQLVFPAFTAQEQLLAALIPPEIALPDVQKTQLEALLGWLSSVPRGHAAFSIPQDRLADLRFLGLMDDQEKVNLAAAKTAGAYIWPRLDQFPEFSALWGHLQQDFPQPTPEGADYKPFNLHVAESVEAGIGNLAFVQAILDLAQTGVDVPTQQLYRAARTAWEWQQIDPKKQPSVKTSFEHEALDAGRWLCFDRTVLFTREAQRLVATDAPSTELEAYLETQLSKAGTPQQLRQFLTHYQNPDLPQRLQDLGVVNAQGQWSELGFVRQQMMMQEAEDNQIPPSLEWLRWALHQRYNPTADVPFGWSLQKDRLARPLVQRARLLAGMALSGGMSGERYRLGETISSDQFRLLRAFGAWLTDDAATYINASYPDLDWLVRLAEHPSLQIDDWQEVCGFVFGKLNQDPNPTSLQAHLAQKGISLPSISVPAKAPDPTQPFNKGFKTGRNDPCPCGSGKKFKKCCGS